MTLSELTARLFFALFICTCICAYSHADMANQYINQLKGK